ncbi:HlyD family type I secretion periplasmic adaptor subunit [Mesorhizobium sp. DCY119]|uniref:HlyD family type I secretion periplasmic adaptor subunit n=1 Tax=Mesorhizobium sp. DCY119 TaxID=2108445 RepID=UPI000E6BFDC7|nr:HlyD family type I secretion periplasmic adaptor subunit [Mesorhizobium sp. DCY119]RJG46613.1 HlyD family type I secretion periplasmic adaptor subunit [Mesorhizobium sp. DCY119]
MSVTQKSLRMTQVFGVLVVLLLVGGVGGWAATTDIAGAVIARGKMSVLNNAKKVQHLEGGIVAKLAVRNGDHVNAGDLLIRLDDTETRANLAIIESQRDEFLIERARLEAERDMRPALDLPESLAGDQNSGRLQTILEGQQKLLKSKLDALTGKKKQLAEQVEQIGGQISGLESQFAAKQRQVEILGRELESLQTLRAKGLVEQSRILALERQGAMLDGDMGQIQAEIGRLRGTISETKLRIIQEDEEWRSEALTTLGEVRAKLATLEEQRTAAIAKLKRIDITAPLSGYVHESNVYTVGGVIGSGEPLMLIIPESDALIVRARVGQRDIDNIHIGQEVRLRFTSLSQRVTPELMGDVTTIAPDVTTDQATGEVYYPIEITLIDGEIKKLEGIQLKPGMPVEAFIQTGMRTALSYLTKPFTEQLQHAFRE